MMISGLTKRVAPIARHTLSRRAFSFSSFTWSSQGNGAVHAAAAAKGAAAAGAGAAAAAGLNYDAGSIPPEFGYDIAVAFQPKNREESNLFKKATKRATGAPERTPAQESPTGEDNLFVTVPHPNGYVAAGVADGVGGWSEAGYDSSAISRELCATAKQIFEHTPAEAVSRAAPRALLSSAFNEILRSPQVEIGGTTACLGIFGPERTLQVANLGDSWCGVFRDYKLVLETTFQTHNFNTPYQLAKIPRQILREAELQGRRYIIDSPERADEYKWQLEQGDIVVFATDGVTDNIVPQDIEVFLRDRDAASATVDLRAVAQEFVAKTVELSRDSNYPSAFAQELSRLTGQKYLGGKEDDITVVFARVK
ncbi:Protein phosphatase [[Candida] zeylanoides]